MSCVLIIGGSGLLGINWAHRRLNIDEVHITTNEHNIKIDGAFSHHLDAQNINDVRKLLKIVDPDLVVNCSGFTSVDACESNPAMSYAFNVKIADNLSKCSAEANINFIQISTDHLFDGHFPKADEHIKPKPQNVYAEHKLEAENIVLNNYPSSLILRTTFFGWGPSYRPSFSDKVLDDLRNDRQVVMYDDVYFTPLHTNEVIDYAHELVEMKKCGIFNLCSSERISKYDFTVLLAKKFGYDSDSIQPIQASRQNKKPKRPLDLSLDNRQCLKILKIDKIPIQESIDYLFQSTELGEKINSIGHYIPYGRHYLDDRDIEAVVKVLRSGALTQGPAILEFERQVCQYTGAKFAVAVSSATAGLHLSYMALGLRSGDSILTSPITFVSTANAAYYCSGKVRFADINPSTANIAFDAVKSSLDSYDDIKIVVPVLFGGSADGIIDVTKYAQAKGKFVVEDAAHGLGGSYECGAKIGSCKYSDCTVFSLHPVKSIAAGEGGVITTNNEAIYNSLLRLRSHGINKNDDPFIYNDEAYTNGEPNLWYYEMSTLGFHYRLTDIQASLANSQLEKLDKFVSRRREIAHRYVTWLEGENDISRGQSVDIDKSANHLFVSAIDFEGLRKTRHDFMKGLRDLSIVTQVHYIPVVNQPFFKNKGFNAEDFPHTQSFYRTALSLPLYYSLTDKEFDYVVEAIQQVLRMS